jgi:hypothetical protein
MIKQICLALALVVLFVFVIRLFAPSTDLQVLQKAASVLQLKTGREVSRSVYDKKKVMGEYSDAEIDLKFEPNNLQTPKIVFDEIISNLLKSNWQRNDSGMVSGYYSATFKVGYATLIVKVAYDPGTNIVSVQFFNRG